MKNTEYLEAGSRGVCGYFEAKQEGTFSFLISSYSSISLRFGVWFYARSGFMHSLVLCTVCKGLCTFLPCQVQVLT